MEHSIKVPTTMPTTLSAAPTVRGPKDKNCFNQIAHNHRLRASEENYSNHQFNLNMHILRNNEGLHAPIKMAMELHAARQIGRLPFLPSSHLMEDVLLGRDEMIDFSDILNLPEHQEDFRDPHAVMERSLGIN